MGLDIGDLLYQRHNLFHTREIDFRINALAVQVHARRHQVHVASALAVTQQGALDTIRPGHHRHFRGGHTATAVVVGMDTDNHVIAVLNIVVNQLYLICKDVRGADFHRGRQVNDHPLPLIRTPHGVHRINDFDGEIRLRGTEGFRGILEAPVGLRLFGRTIAYPLSRAYRNGLAAGLVHVEHLLAERRRGGVVDMHHCIFCAFQGLKRPRDQFFPSLGEHLNMHIVGHQIFLDQGPAKIKIDLAGRRKTHLDFLEAQFHQHLEKTALLRHGHGLDQRLVTVTQVHRRPQGRFLDTLVRPATVGLVDNRKRLIFTVIKAHDLFLAGWLKLDA